MPKQASGNLLIAALKQDGFLVYSEAADAAVVTIVKGTGQRREVREVPISEFVNITEPGVMTVCKGIDPSAEARALARAAIASNLDPAKVFAFMTAEIARKQADEQSTLPGTGGGDEQTSE